MIHGTIITVPGLVGITGAMGARFTASERAFGSILQETAERGLIFVNDGPKPRSVAARISGGSNLPLATDMVVDAVATPTEIDHGRERLEMAARERGFAIGMASALPVSIDRQMGEGSGKPRFATRADHGGGVEGQAKLIGGAAN